MPRRRYGKPGDVQQLRKVLWQSILDTKALTDVPEPSQELVLKVSHALAQLAGPYQKLIQADDFEQRLKKLEEAPTHGSVH